MIYFFNDKNKKNMETHLNNQYFVPDISDLFIGYECEINITPVFPATLEFSTPFWKKDTIPNSFLKIEHFAKSIVQNDGIIRTPYLTKEQIEKEGWKVRATSSDITTFDKGKYEMEFRDKGKILSVGEDLYYPNYNGKCPSINEFRKIMKLLNIK